MKTSNLTTKTALVIGGTSGLGKATAKYLLQSGANVIVAGRKDQSVTDAVNDLKNFTDGNTVKGLTADLGNPDSVEEFIKVLASESKIDYLVNASGIFRPKPFLETTPSEYDALNDITASFYFITQAVSKKMKENGGGSIVNIGSYWADSVVKGMPTSAYSMAKAALHSFTRHIAVELAQDNIRVNAIAPGLFETNVLNEVVGLDKVDETYKSLTNLNPTGQKYMNKCRTKNCRKCHDYESEYHIFSKYFSYCLLYDTASLNYQI